MHWSEQADSSCQNPSRGFGPSISGNGSLLRNPQLGRLAPIAAPQRISAGGGWRRERNWDPTFSEFVGRNLAGGATLKSNCLIENTREFHRSHRRRRPSVAPPPDSEQFRSAQGPPGARQL